MSGGSLRPSCPQQCANACNEVSRLPWNLHQYCLNKCIPFSTQIQGDPGSIPYRPWPAHCVPHRSPTIGLRRHQGGYKPDVFNYTLYEDARDVLLSHPHGRAALMHGGIVWCLAIVSVSDNAVLMGLSQDIFTEGSFLSSADGYLWDDTLLEDDLEVVCGVYKVYTGMFFMSFHFMHI